MRERWNKGGRPTKGDEARKHLVTVRVTKADLDEINEYQKLSYRSKSNIFYYRYKNHKFNFVKVSTYPIEYLRYWKRSSDNLNQIAKEVNTYKENSLSKELVEAIKLVADELKRIQP